MVESHLAFADDVVFFCQASHKSIRALRGVLDEFSEFSGFKINCEKKLHNFLQACYRQVGPYRDIWIPVDRTPDQIPWHSVNWEISEVQRLTTS